MGLRNAHSPFGSDSLLVDKLIGTAYDIVRLVAANLPMLAILGNKMDGLDLIAANLTNTHVVTGNVTGLGQTSGVLLPTGVLQADIRKVDVTITGSDGRMYFPATNTFTYYVDLGYLRISLAAGGPAGLVNAPFRATIVTED